MQKKTTSPDSQTCKKPAVDVSNIFDFNDFDANDNKPQEKCGLFGIYAPEADVARLSFFALHALQHRGQESAGIATSDQGIAHLHKDMGLVTQVFNETNLATLTGDLAIGHTRYSTTGSSKLVNAQPILVETLLGPLGIAHNGNLTNVATLKSQLLERGVALSTSSDTELLVQLLAAQKGDWFDRCANLMQQAEGAYALVILTKDAVYGLRDPWGFRPLCLGSIDAYGENSHVLASESCVFGTIGATFIDEIAPGEVVRMDASGITRKQVMPPKKISLCSFEHIYFARPDSLFQGRVIHKIRQQLGRILAAEAPADADVVISVPDSGTPAAIGYAQALGLPFTEGLTKNRYIARTFIQPNDELRKNAVSLKFNPLPDNVAGKRVVVIDDSIVRGNTMKPLVKMIYDGGATEVHVRISSPPIRYPCFMGVDMAKQENLIAFTHSIEEICERVGATSLAYLSLEGMMQAVANTEINTEANPTSKATNKAKNTTLSNQGYCNACFTGDYPIPLDQIGQSEPRGACNPIQAAMQSNKNTPKHQ